jgi:hypothetical protein
MTPNVRVSLLLFLYFVFHFLKTDLKGFLPLPPLPAPTLITCLMTRVGIVQKLEGWATSVAKLGVVTPINNSLVSPLTATPPRI